MSTFNTLFMFPNKPWVIQENVAQKKKTNL